MRVACVMMQRNEEDCLEPWLRFHGYLFGYYNLFVLDHGSTSPAVLQTLERYRRLGVHVSALPADADYRLKGDYVGAALRRADATGLYDFLLPLDCDEFVVMRDSAGQPTCARDELFAYLESLVHEEAILEVKENFLNTLGHPSVFFALAYQKVFFTRGGCGTVDHGSHHGTSPRSTEAKPTRLVYIHYHHKTYAKLDQSSREKLRPFVNVEDRTALKAYRGTGWHLVLNMFRTEQEYMAIMRPGGLSIEFPEIVTTFEMLGIDPRFCEHQSRAP